MAHWAEIDNNNKVIRVLVGNNSDPNGDEGYQWLIDNLGGTWIKTSYNTYNGVHKLGGEALRKNYAGIGCTYDAVNDVFIAPQPYPSWLLDANSDWQAPTPRPEGIGWYWNEEELTWKEVVND